MIAFAEAERDLPGYIKNVLDTFDWTHLDMHSQKNMPQLATTFKREPLFPKSLTTKSSHAKCSRSSFALGSRTSTTKQTDA